MATKVVFSKRSLSPGPQISMAGASRGFPTHCVRDAGRSGISEAGERNRHSSQSLSTPVLDRGQKAGLENPDAAPPILGLRGGLGRLERQGRDKANTIAGHQQGRASSPRGVGQGSQRIKEAYRSAAQQVPASRAGRVDRSRFAVRRSR